MKPSDGVIELGEWWPDLPALGNPGLTDAKNVLYHDGQYKQFKPLAATGMDDLASEPLGGIITEAYTYVGLTNSIQRSLTSSGNWTDYSASTDNSYATSNSWRFTRFDDFIIGTNGVDHPQMQTLASSSRFTTLSTAGSSQTAPVANAIGKIARFVFVGHTSTAGYHVQWSGIGAPRNWPVPGTAEATTAQAGEQYLNSAWGQVTGIVGGDQFGLIFQQHGITRVSYIAGDEIFQFDELEGSRGAFFKNSIVEAGGNWYFISESGFHVTDGSKVVDIGDGKVDRFFWDSYLDPTELRVFGAVDTSMKQIFWCYQTTAGDIANRIIAYNYAKNRFTYADQNVNCLLTNPEPSPFDDSSFGPSAYIRGFDSGHGGRLFTGTVGTAVITTGFTELVPGGRAFVQGAKADVIRAPVGHTISLIYKNELATANSTTSAASPTSRTEFCDFRIDARYFSAKLEITGTFASVSQIQYKFEPSGFA